jgi:hypothetical protein
MLLRRWAAVAAAAAMVLALATPAAAQGVPSTDAELGSSSLEAKNLYKSWQQTTKANAVAWQQRWNQGSDCARRGSATLCGRGVDDADALEKAALLTSASPAKYRCAGRSVHWIFQLMGEPD